MYAWIMNGHVHLIMIIMSLESSLQWVLNGPLILIYHTIIIIMQRLISFLTCIITTWA